MSSVMFYLDPLSLNQVSLMMNVGFAFRLRGTNFYTSHTISERSLYDTITELLTVDDCALAIGRVHTETPIEARHPG